MNPVEVLLFAVLQGVSELFPISSLGHGVIVPDLFRWQLDRTSDAFLPFMVVLHLGTAVALLVYFRKDWLELLGGFVRAGGKPTHPASRLLWLLMLGTVPAGLLGLLLEKKLRMLFTSTTLVLVFLCINGIVLLFGDRLRRRGGGESLTALSPGGAIRIGLAQALALIPGLSRSGCTLVVGLASGLDYAAAARFSFLLATPIIAAAGLLEIPKLIQLADHVPLGLIAASGVLAGAFAYLSTWFLMRYFRQHDIAALRPFGWYCLGAGMAGLAWKLL